MPHAVTIGSLTAAFEMMKAMQVDGLAWSQDHRLAAGQALSEILEGQMAQAIDRHLDEMARRGEPNRRNVSYSRHLLTELGDIERAAHSHLQHPCRAARLCLPDPGNRSLDAGLLRARHQHPQGGSGAACRIR